MLILAVSVDKGSSVSTNVRLHVPSISLPAARRLQEESGPDLQLVAEVGDNPDCLQQSGWIPRAVSSDDAEKSDPVAGIKNNY